MSDEAMIPVRAALPFRVEATPLGGRAYLTLHYDCTVPCTDGKTRTIPCRQDVGFEDSPASALGLAIYRLMQLYRQVEATKETSSQKEEAMTLAQRTLEHEVRSLRGQVEELKRRLEKETNGHSHRPAAGKKG